LGEIYLIGLAAEKECALVAFEDGHFPTAEKTVDCRFVDHILLLELVDN